MRAWASPRGASPAAVLLVALAVERVLFRCPPAEGFRALGFGRPTGRSLGAAAAVCVPVLVLPWLLAGVGGLVAAPVSNASRRDRWRD